MVRRERRHAGCSFGALALAPVVGSPFGALSAASSFCAIASKVDSPFVALCGAFPPSDNTSPSTAASVFIFYIFDTTTSFCSEAPAANCGEVGALCLSYVGASSSDVGAFDSFCRRWRANGGC